MNWYIWWLLFWYMYFGTYWYVLIWYVLLHVLMYVIFVCHDVLHVLVCIACIGIFLEWYVSNFGSAHWFLVTSYPKKPYWHQWHVLLHILVYIGYVLNT